MKNKKQKKKSDLIILPFLLISIVHHSFFPTTFGVIAAIEFRNLCCNKQIWGFTDLTSQSHSSSK
jgi:hypothetical protein